MLDIIRAAKKDDAERLTSLSFLAKGYWKYPQEYFEIWREELTISPAYIDQNSVFVVERDGVIVGYYSIVELKKDISISGITIDKGFWLEHMFVHPSFIGTGIGTAMCMHLKAFCRTWGIERLCVLADPHARGFYEKMGCTYLKEYPSSIIGRTTPLLQLKMRK